MKINDLMDATFIYPSKRPEVKKKLSETKIGKLNPAHTHL